MTGWFHYSTIPRVIGVDMTARKARKAQIRKLKARKPETSITAITLVLESGERVDFDMEEQLCIPSDSDAVVREARRAPSRYAFWSYQTARALAVVRELEQKLDEAEADADLTYRRAYDEQMPGFDKTDGYYTESVIRSHVHRESDVRGAKIKLNTARRRYDDLRGIKEAMNHRVFILRKLLSREETDFD